jgi:membrane associated rhomboid family serine protease
MPAELFVVLAAGLVVLQMAFVLLRRAFHDERPYLLLLGADLVALVYVHAAGRDQTMGAVVAEVVAVVLTLVPRFLERREADAVERGQLGGARRFALLRELIVPGRASSRRRRQIDHLIEVRQHGSQAVARRLHEELARVRDPRDAEAIHEELVAMLLVDRRFGEAIEHFGKHLGPAFLVRRPGLLPQLVHAHGESGDLTTAALLVAAVESGPAGRDPMLLPLLQRARLLLLAYAGADRALTTLLEGPPGMLLHPDEREHLLRIARGRALSGPTHSAEVEAVLQAETRRAADSVRMRPRPPSRVTWALIGVNVAAYVATLILGGEAALVRVGALFRPAVLSGEWWRGVAAMFLHANEWHLGLNMYGLLLLGRLVEDLAGPTRFFVIYFLGGLVGAAATTLIGAGALSVGASGAIMGLLGALIVILVLRRGTFPEQWRRVLLWNLILLAALQIYIGFHFPMIDNAAHVGGLMGGAAAAVVFAPGLLLGTGRFGRELVRITAALCAGLMVATLVFVIRTPLARTLARLPEKPVELDAVALTVPAHWEVDAKEHKLIDPYLDIVVTVSVNDGMVTLGSPQQGDPRFAALLERVRSSVRLTDSRR